MSAREFGLSTTYYEGAGSRLGLTVSRTGSDFVGAGMIWQHLWEETP